MLSPERLALAAPKFLLDVRIVEKLYNYLSQTGQMRSIYTNMDKEKESSRAGLHEIRQDGVGER